MPGRLPPGCVWCFGANHTQPFTPRVVDKGAQFLLMLGDTYYADVPYFIGSRVPDYEIRARQVGY